MIEYLNKNLITVETGLIIHGCNAQGKMGSGVAKALRDTWPDIFRAYSSLCKEPGNLLGLNTVCLVDKEASIYVMNAITQEYYGNDGKRYADLDAIEECLMLACYFSNNKGLPLYSPKIGCGFGGLDWKTEVKPIYEKVADQYLTTIYVCDLM